MEEGLWGGFYPCVQREWLVDVDFDLRVSPSYQCTDVLLPAAVDNPSEPATTAVGTPPKQLPVE